MLASISVLHLGLDSTRMLPGPAMKMSTKYVLHAVAKHDTVSGAGLADHFTYNIYAICTILLYMCCSMHSTCFGFLLEFCWCFGLNFSFAFYRLPAQAVGVNTNLEHTRQLKTTHVFTNK